jgi:GNAT superfamily N-acetyltransferase
MNPMNNEVHIGIATSGDAEALVDFNCSMALETEEKTLDIKTVTAGVRALLDEPVRGFYVVARREVALVGSLMITKEWSDWRCADFWWIQSVYVRPEARRQGVYRRLYDFVRAQASETDRVCGFRLYVERDNHRAQQTYDALGMRESVYLMYEASSEH